MDRIIYTAMGGAQRTLEQQAVISNNLANASTDGFRRQLAIYRSVPVESPDTLPTRVGTVTSTPGSDFQQGAMRETGRPLDVAITGQGWFSVQTPSGEAYTRGGSFAVNAQGQLVTAQGGLPVLGDNGGPIQVPERGRVTFTGDGAVDVLGAGDNPTEVQQIGRLKLVDPPTSQLSQGADGLFRVGPGGGVPAQADPNVRIVSGFVEQSNVSPAQAMVGMISNSRRFDMQMKVISDAGANEDQGNSILAPAK
ncbi:MAG TPA: flagellar basal-body rod protein FlgF [Burkholderiaceae bacterium]|nr:flagellar basal-body rod protein FlgF [Burkholderiaceae bacterium]